MLLRLRGAGPPQTQGAHQGTRYTPRHKAAQARFCKQTTRVTFPVFLRWPWGTCGPLRKRQGLGRGGGFLLTEFARNNKSIPCNHGRGGGQSAIWVCPHFHAPFLQLVPRRANRSVSPCTDAPLCGHNRLLRHLHRDRPRGQSLRKRAPTIKPS